MQDDNFMELMHAFFFFKRMRNLCANTVANRQWSMEGSKAKKNDLLKKKKAKTRKTCRPTQRLDYKKNKEGTIN